VANTVKLTIKVDDNGSLSVVAKEAKKATDATDKLGRSTDKLGKSRGKFNKGEKGVAGATSNSTKAFSKMRNEMGGGSSGLVGAYATLAANVFALTAAFGVLQRSSQVDQLAQSLQFLGNAAGTNLNIVVDQLKRVTDGALSTEEALRSASVAASAGFSSAQLLQLTTVAKGASVALGRNLVDAQDRLVRGVAKLEPEILDELGILVRLDQASEDYATSLGKTVQQLTIAEKQQAFFNATAEQGTKKYGALAATFETNPYDQLSASLSNLLKDFVTLINTGLVPLVEFLSKSQGALIAFSGLFLSTISSTLLPAMTAMGQKMARNSELTTDFATSNLKGLQSVSKGTTVYSKFVTGIQNGTKSIGDYQEGLSSLDDSVGKHTRGLKKMTDAGDAESSKLIQKRAALNAAQGERLKLIKAVKLHQISSAKMTSAHGLEAMAQGSVIMGTRMLKQSILEYQAGLTVAGVQTTGFTATLNTLRTAGFASALALRALATAFFALLGPLSLLFTLITAGYEIFKEKFIPKEVVDEAGENIARVLNNIKNINEQFVNSSVAGSDRVIAGMQAANGVLIQSLDLMRERERIQQESIRKELAAEKSRIDRLNALEKRAKTQLDRGPMVGGKAVDPGSSFFLREQTKLQEQYNGVLAKTEAAVARLTTLQAALGEPTESAQESLNTLITTLIKSDISKFVGPLVGDMIALSSQMKDGTISSEDFQKALDGIRKRANTAQSFMGNLTDTLASTGKEMNKLNARSSTPFDALLTAAKAVENEFDGLNELAPEIKKNLEENLGATGASILKTFGGKGGAAVRTFVSDLETAIKTIAQGPEKLKANATAQKALTESAKHSVTAYADLVEEQRKGFDLRRAIINAEETANSKLTGQTVEQKENSKADIENKRAALALDEQSIDAGIVAVKTAQLVAKNKQQILNIDKKALAVVKDAQRLSEDMAVVQTKLANAKSRADGSTALSPQQELKIAQDQKAVREAGIKKEYEMKLRTIALDAEMTKISFDLIEAQLLASKTMTADMQLRLNTARATIDTVKKGQEDNAKDQKDLDEKNLALDIVNKTNSAKAISGARGASTSETVTNLFKKEGVKDKDGNDTGDTASIADLATTGQEKIAVLKAGVTQMMDEVAKLGPEGQVVAAVAQGSFAIAEGFTKAFESSATGMEKSAKIAQAVGDSIGAVNSMVQAGISATIAKIDDEINAEKKRDGKSSQSVAKIAAMEKKKEAQKKKAFEVNKKMLMAQTVANTAAGIMSAVAKDGTLGIAMAVLIGAMGAAQLAVIAGTSYQGGGAGASPPGTPSQITMGERSNKSDLATSRSARGELAYARGEDGVGNMANFKPAFSGYKNRAEGGKAGFVVGEQGPELFVPEMPGRIVPNDDIGAGGLGNVQFNINTVDASGVEDLLVAQRGNIIGMIRQAANSYGQDFVEDVDTSTFTQSAGGVSKY
jgi:hypothetical protein